MKSFLATIATLSLILTAGFSSAQEPASTPKSPRCAVAKSTTVEQTADGKTVIRIQSVQVCK